MLHGFIERLRQKKRTVPYPKTEPLLPERFRGWPVISAGACSACSGACPDCSVCAAVCPAGAINLELSGPCLDLGRCTFCGACAQACPAQAITFSREYRLATTRREDLLVRPGAALLPGASELSAPPAPSALSAPPALVSPLTGRLRAMFGRSLKIRQVSAAGCNACEADCNVLGTIVFDLPRFGIDYVASPRHADALLITGPVPENMRLALEKCYAATPAPKLVIAVGACAISGGLFRNLSGQGQGVPEKFAPALFIPGCPPNPYTILNGLLRLLGRIE